MSSGPVLVATDLTEHARPALLRGRAHARAIGVPLVVCHVVLDVFRNHPLIPDPAGNQFVIESNVIARAAELASEQVREVLGSAEGCRVVVESGRPDEEIVRLAEREEASLVVVGAKPREGAQRVLGHVAERVVRHAPGSVLVARARPAGPDARGAAVDRAAEPPRNILVATDFTEGSLPALEIAAALARSVPADGPAAQVTLLHVMTPPSTMLSSAFMPLGGIWSPPAKAAVDQLEALGRRTLESLASEHGFTRFEQVQGLPGDVIIERAEALDVDLVVMGSRGRRGFVRLVLGSVAEKVIRASLRSVLVARESRS